jgi:hypothetical protein
MIWNIQLGIPAKQQELQGMGESGNHYSAFSGSILSLSIFVFNLPWHNKEEQEIALLLLLLQI